MPVHRRSQGVRVDSTKSLDSSPTNASPKNANNGFRPRSFFFERGGKSQGSDSRWTVYTAALLIFLILVLVIVVSLKPSSSTVDNTVIDIKELQTLLKEKEIELAWERQHVSDLEERDQYMLETILQTRDQEEGRLESTSGATTNLEEKSSELADFSVTEERDDDELKAKLKQDMDDTVAMSKNANRRKSNVANGQRNLRGFGYGTNGESLYKLGETVEIFDYQEGKTALHPGIVFELSNSQEGRSGALYTLINANTSTKLSDMKEKQFQHYEIYPRGSQAFYSTTFDEAISTTIVEYIAPTGIGEAILKGKYIVSIKGREGGILKEVPANQLFRYLENAF